ncbi:MAG: hypothetical protein PF551_04700 [Candidatus Marinimicrobia bacterium]|jgi:hypothetical protein|nr:hypothetical protein [Candidatus Neomarinimicrobiota bacterium]
MKCPNCNNKIAPYKVWLISRWTSVRCNKCGIRFGRKINMQFIMITLLIIIPSPIIKFAPLLFFSWLFIVMIIDAYTIQLIEKTTKNTYDLKKANSKGNKLFHMYKYWWITIITITIIVSIIFPENYYDQEPILAFITQALGTLFFGFVIMIFPIIISLILKKEIKGKIFMITYSICIFLAIIMNILAWMK